MDPAGKQPVRVTILNQPYSLLAEGDPREVEEVARSVDSLMNSISARAKTADSTRIAVLACLHLADRLRGLERDLTALQSRVDNKSEQFSVMLAQAMELEPEPESEPKR